MESEIPPHPLATKVIDFSDWACNTTECTEIIIETSFQPEFTYPIFGDHETAFGYKNLLLKIKYTSGSLRPFVEITYSSQYSSPSSSSSINEPVAADDLLKTLDPYLPQHYLTNYNNFIDAVIDDYTAFKPLGEKIQEYSQENNDGSVEYFEIYKSNFSNEKFREYHSRMQLFVLLFIEGSSYIEDDDDKWEIYTTFKREKINDSYAYHFVGYFLPPYKKKGHGSKLYQTIYQLFRSRKEICEITVEDPNEEFSDMRDKNDIRYLAEHNAFKDIQKAPIADEKLNELCEQFKLTKRQTQRCLEMYLLSKLDKLNKEEYKAYRLQVKKRLFAFNYDILRDVEDEERKLKLHETYLGVEEDYYRLLELI
ncbi:acyl-CoA N-acyltransferase [Cokeromyces recurvatus]|uniref:acyl-CoA N-acyltransferase n=1 Tax=Cokeromyces recurvatus TaxID=90255 RepID=UPI002220F8E6|nr:acyl-CoA N-acyltransferase [Cokeromyces recurvatus]KAI7907161.1 acyl-CoA N-acyltransferase [Cokeromyces recurvatus]